MYYFIQHYYWADTSSGLLFCDFLSINSEWSNIATFPHHSTEPRLATLLKRETIYLFIFVSYSGLKCSEITWYIRSNLGLTKQFVMGKIS